MIKSLANWCVAAGASTAANYLAGKAARPILCVYVYCLFAYCAVCFSSGKKTVRGIPVFQKRKRKKKTRSTSAQFRKNSKKKKREHGRGPLHAGRDALDAHEAVVRAVEAENARARERYAAAMFAHDDHKRKVEERKRVVAANANAHRMATREALIAWEHEKAAAEKNYEAAAIQVSRANAIALREAREAFDADEKVRELRRRAEERKHEEMERAMRERHKSLEMSEELFRWKTVRYKIAHKREELANKLAHTKRNMKRRVVYEKAKETLERNHETITARWAESCDELRAAARAEYQRSCAAAEAGPCTHTTFTPYLSALTRILYR